MSPRQEVLSTLEVLDPGELEQVAHLVRFLTFRRRINRFAPNLNDEQLAAIYGAAETEDRGLAEAGLGDYQAALLKEDSA